MWSEAIMIAVAGFLVVCLTLVVLAFCVKIMSAGCRIFDKKGKTGPRA